MGPEELLTYHMKFRFYFQPYTAASAETPASHQNLLRMYYQTEAQAGEYDVPKCAEGLIAPVFLPFNANLTSIKRNNNTYAHYGEMASWQMRGILAYLPIDV